MRQSRICLRPESPVEASVVESGVSAPLGREGATWDKHGGAGGQLVRQNLVQQGWRWPGMNMGEREQVDHIGRRELAYEQQKQLAYPF